VRRTASGPRPGAAAPGPFDRQILIQPPDLKGRIAILDVHTRGKPLAPDVELASVARQTSGLTGADLANICNEAAIGAGRRSSTLISAADFDYALERVVAGLQQRRVVTDKEKRILAYHEGGHALMSYLVGNDPQKATIIARGSALGYVLHLPEEERYLETKEELLDWMVVALAGRAAEEVVFGRVTNGAANDLEKVTQIARSMVFEWGMGESSRRARCAPTTTRSPRRRSGCATPSRRCSPTAPTASRCAWCRSTGRRSTASPRSCSNARP
jgi:ATP-dependent Zn proteases